MDIRYQPAFDNRIRRVVDLPGMEPFAVWAARPEDVIVGKLMAWEEGRSERHTADIFEMMVFHYLGGKTGLVFDVQYVTERAQTISQEAVDLWHLIVTAAQEETADH
jgi:hypothetical protein